MEAKMYKEFYGFSEEPFILKPDPRFFFLTPRHQSALNLMHYGITQRRGFILLTGDRGTGKTSLIQKLLQTLDPGIKAISIYQPPERFDELLEVILQCLKVPLSERGKSVLWRQFINYISHGEYKNLVIIVDNAQKLSKEFLEELRELWNPCLGRLQEILVGRTEIEDKLNSWDMRQLRGRIAIRCRVNPLNEDESLRYIGHRLTRVGGNILEIFNPGALSLICRHSRGIPERINQICAKALWAGYSLSKKPVDSSIIKETLEDSGILPQEEPAMAPLAKMVNSKLSSYRVKRAPFTTKFLNTPEYMYGNFNGSLKKPFDPIPDPTFFFINENARGVWNSIISGIAQRKSFILLTGESGIGKTTLIALVYLYLTTRGKKVIPFFRSPNNIKEIWEKILQDLGLSAEKESKGSMLFQLEEDLIQRSAREKNIILIFDEAQNLRKETLEEIRLFTESSPKKPKFIQEIFVGDLQFERILLSRDLSDLNQRFEVRCRLRPFTAAETLKYIEHRLSKAGSTMSKVFTLMALKKITQSSRGISHKINLICNEALDVGSTQMEGRTETVNVRNVREALANLGMEKLDGWRLTDKTISWIRRCLRFA